MIKSAKLSFDELKAKGTEITQNVFEDTINGSIKYRPVNQPLYDPSKSKLSEMPEEWK